eukprot:symbB.v1.2.033179.t1/scaffold4024.1/size46069/3
MDSGGAGGAGGTRPVTTAVQQAELLEALQVASLVMEPTAESMEAMATIIGRVADLGPMSNTSGRMATSLLEQILNSGTGTSAFNDQRVATSMFQCIGKIAENMGEDLSGDPQQEGGFQRELQDLILNLGDALVSNMQNESYASLTNDQMQLEVSKSQRVITAGSEAEHIQKGHLHMETGTSMAASRRLQQGNGQAVTVTAKLLMWKDFKVSSLDTTKGFNSIIPSQLDVIITEIGQECIGSKPLVHSVGTRHVWPQDLQPAMTRTTCAQFNETEVVWTEAATQIYGDQMHVDCFSSPSCGDMVQRATSTVLHVPDVWGTFADVIFILWLFLTILSVLITVGVTVILSVYKYETHMKHVGAEWHGRLGSRQEGPKAHAWSVVPAQIPPHGMISSSESHGESHGPEELGWELLEMPEQGPKSTGLLQPGSPRRPSLQGHNWSDERLGPVDSTPLSQALSPRSNSGAAEPKPVTEEIPPPLGADSFHPSLPSEEMVKLKSSVREAWG